MTEALDYCSIAPLEEARGVTKTSYAREYGMALKFLTTIHCKPAKDNMQSGEEWEAGTVLRIGGIRARDSIWIHRVLHHCRLILHLHLHCMPFSALVQEASSQAEEYKGMDNLTCMPPASLQVSVLSPGRQRAQLPG